MSNKRLCEMSVLMLRVFVLFWKIREGGREGG